MKNCALMVIGSIFLSSGILFFLPGCPIGSMYYHEGLANAARSQMKAKKQVPDIIVSENAFIVNELLDVIIEQQKFERIDDFHSSIVDSLKKDKFIYPSDNVPRLIRNSARQCKTNFSTYSKEPPYRRSR